MSLPAAVLSVKKRALEAKKAGDIEEAKRLLTQAKQLETLQDPLELKRLAAQFQEEGHDVAAKEALQKASEYEGEEEEVSATGEALASYDAPVVYENPVNHAIDAANLEELSGNATSQFTDEEMLDVDTMADMRDAGMDIPSQEAFVERSKFHRQRAIEFRDKGDIANAKTSLLFSKKLEIATNKLFQEANVLEEEDDGEDYSLLDELNGNGGVNDRTGDDGFMDQLFGTNSNAVTLDDLDDLDPSMLRDMMEAGMEIPDVDQVMSQAAERKSAAIVFKKAGNIVAAKAALEESKRLESKAARLSDLLTQMTSGTAVANIDDPEAMLEAMMAASEAPAPTQVTKQAQPVAPKEPEKMKSSQEYKVEAVRFKQENKIQEATAALRLYKQALAAETSAAEVEKRKECKRILDNEVKFAAEQIRRFSFYKRFVREESEQIESWDIYMQECQKAVRRLEKEAVELKRSDASIKQIIGEGIGFVGHVDPQEERMEVAILYARDLLLNKNLTEILKDKKGKSKIPNLATSIRLKVTVQLPPDQGSTDEVTELVFKPSSAGESDCVFRESQWVNTKRGTSRFAKTIVRKLAQKRILIEVIYAPPSRGFWASAPEETLLGTVVVKMNDLLSENYIAGDFPLLDSKRRKEVGGFLRLAIRTGLPFTTAESPEVDTIGIFPSVELISYPAFSFAKDDDLVSYLVN